MSARYLGASWWIDLRFDGDRYRRRSPDNSKAGAQAYEAMLRQRLSRGEPIDAAKPTKEDGLTFEQFVPEWIETYVRSNSKNSEAQSKLSILKWHLIPWFGEMPLKDITFLDIEQFKAAKSKTKLSPKTINNHLATLSKCLNCAFDWGRLDAAPPKIKRLKTNSGRIDFLSPVESWRLLQDKNNGMWNCALLIALRTGMRFGELLGLDWSDINWDKGILTVKQSLVRGVMGTPKSGKIRHIPMAPDVIEALADRRKIHGLIFERPAGEKSTHRVATNALNQICKRTGVRRANWHLLRHTFASHLAMEGIPIPVVQQLLGHASINMTMRYSHLSPSKLSEAVAVFQALEKREVEKFGQQVGKGLIKRTISESPVLQQVAKEMAKI